MPGYDLRYSALILCAALLLDKLIGDPAGMPHPVCGVGRLISWLEGFLYDERSRLRGAALTLASIFIVVAVIEAVLKLLSYCTPLYVLAEIYLIYAALAWRSLKDESRIVARKLRRGDLDGARYALSRIVGRDTENLNRESIVRAAVETVGENSIDAVFSPLFFVMVGFALGCPAAAVWAFKTVSTLDSMVGYKNKRYLNFGCFSARLDDVLNFIPARIGAAFMLLAGRLNGYGTGRSVIAGVLRDRLRHASPNSAHGESVMAWLLGIELGGANSYGGVVMEKPTLGIATRSPEIADIERSHEIMDYGVTLFLLVCLLAVLLAAGGN